MTLCPHGRGSLTHRPDLTHFLRPTTEHDADMYLTVFIISNLFLQLLTVERTTVDIFFMYNVF